MIRKTNEKTLSHVERTYNVYDKDNNLIDSLSKRTELIKKYNIRNQYNIWASNRNNVYFYPNKHSETAIRIEIKTKEIIENIIKPFILNETEIQNIVNLPNEEWKQIQGFGGYYYCSNKGRFKVIDTKGNEKLLKPFNSLNRTKKVYTNVALNPVNANGTIEKALKFRTSRVLAQTWLDPTLDLSYKKDKRVIDHIDNNSENENIENLRICSYSDNIRYAIYEQGKNVGTPKKTCYSLDIFTNEIKEYTSTNKLVNAIFGKINNGYFNHYSKFNSLAKGRYLIGYDIEKLKELAKKKSNKNL